MEDSNGGANVYSHDDGYDRGQEYSVVYNPNNSVLQEQLRAQRDADGSSSSNATNALDDVFALETPPSSEFENVSFSETTPAPAPSLKSKNVSFSETLPVAPALETPPAPASKSKSKSSLMQRMFSSKKVYPLMNPPTSSKSKHFKMTLTKVLILLVVATIIVVIILAATDNMLDIEGVGQTWSAVIVSAIAITAAVAVRFINKTVPAKLKSWKAKRQGFAIFE